MTSNTEIAWPEWVLRYIASDDKDAYSDAIWSVGGSPPWGGVSYEEAEAIYHLLEDYLGPGTAKTRFYNAARARLKNSPDRQAVLELFLINDQITSNPDSYGADVVARGMALCKQVKHDGVLGTFLCYQSGLAYRSSNLSEAMQTNWQALEIFLRLADEDPVYAKRAAQCSQNAVSYLALSGDQEAALRLRDKLAPVLEGFDFSDE
jgi:hypothetical protein